MACITLEAFLCHFLLNYGFGPNLWVTNGQIVNIKSTKKRGGGAIFSICSVLSLTHCHSWNSLPCINQQFSIIATCYRPPATTISFYSYISSSPVKKKTSSNRLGTSLSQWVEKPEGPSALQPTTESLVTNMGVLPW